jgi:aldehyde:ferredoxin oxidoreductase
MTPEIEKILNACVDDIDWFIKVFEQNAGDDRFQKPLERFQKIRARLDLLKNAVTVALLKTGGGGGGADSATVDELKGDLGKILQGVGRVESGLGSTADGVADIQKYISSSSLEEIFRALIRAAGGSPPAASAAPALAKAVPAPAKAAKAAPAKKAAKPAKAKLPRAVGTKKPQDFYLNRYHVDMATKSVKFERVQCQDYEDVLGGIARAFKILENHAVDDAYDPKALFIMNLGILSGSDFMTGLRTYFHGYSPLKVGVSGKPGSMWTAGSGKFSTKLKFLDIDEVYFTGTSETPVTLRLAPPGDDGGTLPEGRSADDGFGVIPAFHFLDASELVGKISNDKIQALRVTHGKDAHFAVIGPAGEAYQNVRYAAIALSTVNQLKSGDNKPRFCGRGGFGGVMGSKNLLALVADGPDRLMERPKPSAKLKELNMEVARGKGSARFRDKKRANGGGGTWANYEALGPVNAAPEMNFIPTGTDVSKPLYRPAVEAMGTYVVKDEACFRCGIACHKNVYDAVEIKGKMKPGKFRAKLDFEPLNLLASNIGIFDIDEACELVELVDLYCMDSISIGVTLSYAMEYNKRNAASGKTIANGLAYGDYEATKKAIELIGTGQMPELGQGSKRLGDQVGAPEYAMHCKGVEFPAYLPQTNPGYPWALAGGHMSMKTYLLLLYERDTNMDYWVDAITNRGPAIMRDDIVGVCKFSALPNDQMAEAISEQTDLEIDGDILADMVKRTYLRGYRMEKNQGFEPADYTMPGVAHEEVSHIDLPHFNTAEFFKELQPKVLAAFDKQLEDTNL